MTLPIIIIGTGASGIAAARAIRQIDKSITVILVSDSTGYTYSKPKLSYMCSQHFNEECLNILSRVKLEDFLLCKILPDFRIIHIDTNSNTLVSEDQRIIKYSALIIASGATAKKSEAAKSSSTTVHSCNSLVEYRQIISNIRKNQTITIVGGGVIGSEIAYDLSSRYSNVHLICKNSQVLSGVIDNKKSREIENRLVANHVVIHKDCSLKSYEKIDGITFLHAETKTDQLILQTDLIIEAIGLTPNVPFIKDTNILYENGICVDRKLSTNIPNIYALGDCASFDGKIISNIRFINDCAKIIASNLLIGPTSLNETNYDLSVKVGQPFIKTQFII